MGVVLTVRPGQGCMVAEVSGYLDMTTSPQLHDTVLRVFDGGARNVVVDLAGVDFMDSSGLGALVAVFKAARDRGNRLCLAAVQQPVRSLLSITSVDQVIEVHDTVLAAEASMPPAVA